MHGPQQGRCAAVPLGTDIDNRKDVGHEVDYGSGEQERNGPVETVADVAIEKRSAAAAVGRAAGRKRDLALEHVALAAGDDRSGMNRHSLGGITGYLVYGGHRYTSGKVDLSDAKRGRG